MERNNEQGFGVVELIVGLLIVAILLAVGITYFGSSKSHARVKQVVAAAQQYADAVSRYRNDHSFMVPATISVGGPTNTLLPTPRPYMQRLPEGVDSGYIVLVPAFKPSPGARVFGQITYAVNAGTDFTLSVWAKKADGTWPSAATPTCQITSGAPPPKPC